MAEFIFSATHDAAVNVADNLASISATATMELQSRIRAFSFSGGNNSADGALNVRGKASLCSSWMRDVSRAMVSASSIVARRTVIMRTPPDEHVQAASRFPPG